MSDALLQIGGIISTVCSTLVILARMRRYVTIEEYRNKVAFLHDKINEQAIQIVRLEERAAK